MVSSGKYNPSPKDSSKDPLNEDEFDSSIIIWLVLISVGIIVVAVCCQCCCPKKQKQTSAQTQARQLPSEQTQGVTQVRDDRPESHSEAISEPLIRENPHSEHGMTDVTIDQEENDLTTVARALLNPSDNSSNDQSAPPPMYHELEGPESAELPPPPSYDEFMAAPNKYTQTSN